MFKNLKNHKAGENGKWALMVIQNNYNDIFTFSLLLLSTVISIISILSLVILNFLFITIHMIRCFV